MSTNKEIIKLGQIEVTFLLEAKDTNNAIATFEFLVPIGAKVPIPHSHESYDEIVYGLEGILTYTINDKVIEVGEGETLFIPRGAAHGFNNLHQQHAKGLAAVTPALIGPDFFKEVGVLIAAGGPPDVEKLKEIYSKWGLKPSMP
jgi:quercetin dioxygenase-like cupin family protein